MFFVFAYGSVQDGAVAGGMGDCQYQTHDIDEARAYALNALKMSSYVEILDGENGHVWQYVCTNLSTRAFDWRVKD